MYMTGHHVGRLVEIRIWAPVTVTEAHEWGRELSAITQRIRGQYVCLVDLFDAQVFPPQIADVYLATMRSDSAKLERTAVLVGHSATLGFQIQRMIMEAKLDRRKVFQTARDLEPWLGEVLTEPEKQRLHAALEENNRFEDPDVEPGDRASAIPFSFIPASHIPSSTTPVSNAPGTHAPSSPPVPSSGSKRPPGSGHRR